LTMGLRCGKMKSKTVEAITMKRNDLNDEAAKCIRDTIHNLIYIQSLLEANDTRQDLVDTALFSLTQLDGDYLDDCVRV
jgi:hypothetical protein